MNSKNAQGETTELESSFILGDVIIYMFYLYYRAQTLHLSFVERSGVAVAFEHG